MRVMVLVKATKECEQGIPPSPELVEAMTKFNQELIEAGVMLAADGLQPSSKGARVRFEGSKRTVTDGPFAELKELIGGYWVWQVKSMGEAIEWVKRAPFDRDIEVEIRPIRGIEDFPFHIASELSARQDEQREQLATIHSK